MASLIQLSATMICEQPFAIAFLLAVGQFVGGTPALAQVLPDGSLPTVVNSPDNLNFAIEGGGRSGNNLFHSFSQFSVSTGGSAIFNNATDVQNIFSRVTGSKISNIDGLIQAKGIANLFLLNPNGIVFGPKAALNIGGAFLGTTASSIHFSAGAEFSAISPTLQPLLTMSVPIGLQFGAQAAPITNRSTVGLQVKTAQTLALVGGDLLFEGGRASAPSGQIELGSVAPHSWVGLTFQNPGGMINYDAVNQFQTINLTQSARLDASGSRNAGIQIQGRQVSFQNGSTATVTISGAESGQGITIRATDAIELLGVSADGKTQSGLTSTVQASATGQGGEIRLEAPTLRLWDGARATTRTFGAGQGGNLLIRANQVDVKGRDATESNTSELTARVETNAKGRGGDITIVAQSVQVRDGAAIKSRTQGSGNAGNLLIQAPKVMFVGRSPKGSNVDISTNSREEATGNGGNLVIEAAQVQLQGASLRSRTYGAGAAGNILVNAQALIVADSRITTEADLLATGPGGNIHLTAETLKFLDGGQALASTSGRSTAGNLSIIAQSLEIAGRSPQNTPPDQQVISGLEALSEGKGAAGEINLTTDSLMIREGAIISVSGEGDGNAGNLRIQSNTIKLDTGGSLLAEANAGSQGNIMINANSLLMRHSSNITTNAYNRANGGTIMIQVPLIVGLENSDIVANALQGKGGNIQITTQGLFGLKFRPKLTPENDITASSEFGVNGTVQVNTIGIDPNSGLTALPVDTVDPSQQIATGCSARSDSSFVATGRGGVPENPIQVIAFDRVWSDLRTIPKAKPEPRIAAASMPIEATALAINAQGEVELIGEGAIASNPIGVTCSRQ